jgi:hypothetical protein
MHVLDPRSRYMPAAETDVSATWRRFGFDSRRYEKRPARLRQRMADEKPEGLATRPRRRPW